jgi:hypothetical protein
MIAKRPSRAPRPDPLDGPPNGYKPCGGRQTPRKYRGRVRSTVCGSRLTSHRPNAEPGAYSGHRDRRNRINVIAETAAS